MTVDFMLYPSLSLSRHITYLHILFITTRCTTIYSIQFSTLPCHHSDDTYHDHASTGSGRDVYVILLLLLDGTTATWLMMIAAMDG